MTPAILTVRKAGLPFQTHEYSHDPAVSSYGLEAAIALQVDASRVFKTLVVALEGDMKKMAIGIVPVTQQLDVKALAKAVGAKKAEMADPKQAERITGYLVGGISPLGQKRKLPTVLDESALNFETIFVSAGRRGLEIELCPTTLMELCQADAVAICR
ncbi:Cys-tRNA(Pro) deacylase [uncultured Thiothrix sp.]|uniref:Cys-tRNA(Pro) deacylase n=1 Tax=uncultured Thiothrix sp. TaxID=223185 RepID=UPI00262E22CE|nr:Cys-tRNA(Pro) deacylase [uncultured Thiothrix sp.]HMT93058.1 Cys-tRNA(Pro) deacylase [Thiolinea sp.]